MRIRSAMFGLMVGALLAAAPSSASAATLGSTTLPTGATAQSCSSSSFFVQLSSEPGASYTVPAGGGMITSWSINTIEATPGTPITLLVLRPTTGSNYTLVGFDSESVPNPAVGTATFHIASPIAVQGGDVLGLYSTGSTVKCYFGGGATSASSAIAAGAPSSLSVGATYTRVAQQSSLTLNVSAELAQSEDAGVSSSATPATITTGGAAEYLLSVSNAGPASGAISLTDVIPSGLTVLSAVASEGNCTVAGPVVKCTMSVAPGGSAPVSIVVSTPMAGVFTNTATVSTTLTDPNAANNVATSKLTVTPPSCKLIKLTGQSLTLAKQLISALGCKVGKVIKKASKSVHKGLVISTSPKAGVSVPAGTAVNIVVSSGPPSKKHGKHGSKAKKH